MTVETKHPSFTSARTAEFALMRNAINGESAVKAAAETYLPKPSGFNAAADSGTAMYDAYRARAQFPEIVAPTTSAIVGIIHGKEIEINIPSGLDYIYERATPDELSLEAFHRRITRELVNMGRYSVLTDAPENGGEPYMCGYPTESLINWDTDFFVIDDSGMVRTGYDWEEETRHIVLEMGDAGYQMKIIIGNDEAKQEIKEVRGTGNAIIDRVPFVVGNAIDVSPNLITPPLIGVSRAGIAIYQLSADYRHQLFMSGQETLVAINGEAPEQVGAGVAHSMSGAEGVTPDLKYVSPSCRGIQAHKEAMLDNREAAVMAGAKMIEQEASGPQESGYARKLRFSSETATLSSVAKVSCEILERSLRNVAMMKGLTEAQQDEITVTPPKDLMDTTISPQDAKALVEAWQAGGYSYLTLYENLQRGGIASPERDFEDELLAMDDDPQALREAQQQALLPAA